MTGNGAILPDLSQLSREQLLAQIEAMRKAASQRVTLKVSKQGAVSLYGLGQFPVTLYASQWERVIEAIPSVRQFMVDHAGELARKA